MRGLVPQVGDRKFRILGALHWLPPERVITRLREDLAEASDGADWYACVLFGDGSGILRPQHALVPPPPEEVVDRMIEFVGMTNRDIHHGGHWVALWADDLMHFLWRDIDGDMHLTNTFDEPWVRVRLSTTLHMVERAEACWLMWQEHMIRQDIASNQKYRRALGEAPPARNRMS